MEFGTGFVVLELNVSQGGVYVHVSVRNSKTLCQYNGAQSLVFAVTRVYNLKAQCCEPKSCGNEARTHHFGRTTHTDTLNLVVKIHRFGIIIRLQLGFLNRS